MLPQILFGIPWRNLFLTYSSILPVRLVTSSTFQKYVSAPFVCCLSFDILMTIVVLSIVRRRYAWWNGCQGTEKLRLLAGNPQQFEASLYYIEPSFDVLDVERRCIHSFSLKNTFFVFFFNCNSLSWSTCSCCCCCCCCC